MSTILTAAELAEIKARHERITGQCFYARWETAGGPRQCAHGYAAGIPCPRCDADNYVTDIPRLLAHAEALWAAIEAAPHEDECLSLPEFANRYGERLPCDCWKAVVLK